ncbi:hypothetical protein [Agrobacterium fabrum]|uniref:Uncharacterized protein n=1 Tax=Agrobacterium fabrum TaxID=1176649 RepID=A0A7Z7BSN7_9HYPH|nr:hypothetical protein [Agrobacterium fabrum]MCR6727549.1 hypothetical protein [Agrobacterium fabrum]NTB10635.1 hypothetical protein [Agrobacterium fabrum]UXT60670.1 hypothetical protein FY134_23455 [Agrobacterium fabrum]WCK79598.1 hypothetical protein G6L39_024375 [Agrobacterium fabrum]WIE30946.1 hypothetical protein G6L42_023280 [Agrobacterium fabrum]
MKIISITLMGICLAAPAQAQNIDFDIFDVRIGDSPAKVSKTLATKGFEPNGELRGPSFEERLGVRRKEINEFEARGSIKELQFSREADRVTLHFTAWPDGEKVSGVFYRPNMTYDDCPQFVASATVKYQKGIDYAGGWIDRPVEKNVYSTRTSPETVSVQVQCSRGSRYLSMSLFAPQTIQSQMLDKADVKPKNDF